jgi:hypothetical protein
MQLLECILLSSALAPWEMHIPTHITLASVGCLRRMLTRAKYLCAGFLRTGFFLTLSAIRNEIVVLPQTSSTADNSHEGYAS